jgi:acyl carrier protein phosphodiesterase
VHVNLILSRAYGILVASKAMFPERLRAMIPVMVREDWLGSYQDLKGVEQALIRLSKRITRGDRLLGAIEEIKDRYLKLEANFFIFFLDLKYFVRKNS